MGFIEFMENVRSDIVSCDVDQAKKMHENGVCFIDVRTKESFDAGHIPNAVHMDRGMLEFYMLEGSPLQMSDYSGDFDRQFIIYCDKGGQSSLATKTLNDLGFKNACNLTGGYTLWKES